MPDIRANPAKTAVMDGVKFIRENGCDFIVALDSGSVMDASKGIAMTAANEGDLLNMDEVLGKFSDMSDAVTDNQISRYQDIFRDVALGADDLICQFFQSPPADPVGRDMNGGQRGFGHIAGG